LASNSNAAYRPGDASRVTCIDPDLSSEESLQCTLFKDFSSFLKQV